MRLAAFLLRHCAQGALTLLGVVLVNFCLLHMAPGDAVDVLAGEAGAASPEYLARLRQEFGLDASLPVQLSQYLGRIARLDFGYSFRNQAPVLDLILGRIGPTLLLMGVSFCLALGLGVGGGVLASRKVGRPADVAISVATLIVYATPIFWVGLMLIVLFSVKLGWLPGSGYETIASGYTGLARVADIARHTVMPALALSLFYMASYARLMRASMLQVAGEDFARTARAKGLSERRVSYRHVFPNALLPVVTIAGVQVGALLGGSVLVESVFAWPGLGRLAFEAVLNRDKNLLLGLLLISSGLVVVTNMVVDALYAVLDPRVEAA